MFGYHDKTCFQSDGPRLAIQISLGHRNNSFFLLIHNTFDLLSSDLTPSVITFINILIYLTQLANNQKQFRILSARSPLFSNGPFLDVVFATRVLQNDMFCQALGTERDFPGS